MELTLPMDVIAIMNALTEAGFQAYIVGGAVRDVLLYDKVEPTDWDFTTDATPEQILEIFPEAFYENEFGTVAIAREHVREQFQLGSVDQEHLTADTVSSVKQKTIDLEQATKIHESLVGKQDDTQSGQSENGRDAKERNSQTLNTEYRVPKSVFEITTFRSDGMYTDFRRPDEVTWGKTIEEDLKRRDFTINAMALKINSKIQIPNSNNTIYYHLTPNTYSFIDPHSGQQDLDAKILRTVGEANVRFQEDALRMLRAIRFSVQLEFEIHPQVLNAIAQHADLIQHVSWERIRDEFLKMIASDHPKLAIELLDETHLLQYILPELIQAQGVEQGGHHTTDVWTHSLDALDSCPSPDPIVRFATLLHDIAKPQTFARNGRTITFYNHEIIGSRVAKNIATRFRLSKNDIQRVFTLVRYHMFHYQPENTDAAIRRFMRKVGLENINDIIDLRIGDRLGSGARETSWRLEEMKQRMQEQLHQPFSVNDLAIDGNDLMTELQLRPGPLFGKILNTLFEEVAENPELNSKDVLLEKAQQLASNLSNN